MRELEPTQLFVDRTWDEGMAQIAAELKRLRKTRFQRVKEREITRLDRLRSLSPPRPASLSQIGPKIPPSTRRTPSTGDTLAMLDSPLGGKNAQEVHSIKH
jgi:hypothetical protein